jgi:Asp/Glu/hydantoin racemase
MDKGSEIMAKVALIHTVRSVLSTFDVRVKEAIGDVKLVNTLDEYLASDPAERGEFTIENMNRLLSLVKCAEMTEADAVVVTCSTLSPTVEKIRPFVKIPVIAIDDAMIRKAAECGRKTTILATADSTVGPTKEKLLREAAKLNKEVEISVVVCPDAYIAMKAGDVKYHDEVLKRKSLEIKQQDAVILAQASMAHLQEIIEKICGCTVLSSPNLCVNELKETLQKLNKI